MRRSRRHLSPRTARDWWTKGLLPRPRRHGLGRSKGTETFWPNPRVVEQAKLTHDLLARHSRTYSVRIGLWLSGYPVELKAVRVALKTLIARNHPRRDAKAGKMRLDDAVGLPAARVGRKLLQSDAPLDVRQAAIGFSEELLSVFFGVGSEPEIYGLAELVAATAPYWLNKAERPFLPDDESILWLMNHVQKWFSLPIQRKIRRSATNYEFVRARRVLRIVFGNFDRTSQSLPASEREALQEQSRLAVIILSRAVLLPLIQILRDQPIPRLIPALLDASRKMKLTLRGDRAFAS